jgi:hypothetical protein
MRNLCVLALCVAGAVPRAAAAQPAAKEASGNTLFTPPRGWTPTVYPDGTVYRAPPFPGTDERCQLTIFPTRPGTGDLLRDAIGTFQALFKSDPMTGPPYPSPSLARGTSPFGWDYLVLRKEIGGNGYYGETTTGIIVFVARLGPEIAVVVGISKRPLVSRCFGELQGDEWPAFFHSIRFKGWKEKVSDEAMTRRLLGRWTSSGSSRVLIQYTFGPGGRYANGNAVGHTSRVSPTEIQTTIHGFRGDGAWAVRGNTLTLTEDKGSPEPGLFRLEEESTEGRVWKERLCVLGKTGDVCYAREP